MAERPVTIRIPEQTRLALSELALRSRRDFSSIINEMLEEGLRMRRIPGITFASEGLRREAKVGGTGVGAWEIIAAYKRLGEDWERLREAYEWLNELQLRAALAYWRAYPQEIDARLGENENWTPETLYATYPFMKPPEPRPRQQRRIAER